MKSNCLANRAIIVTAAALVLSTPATAANGVGGVCESVLVNGVMDKSEWRTSEHAKLVLLVRISKMSVEEGQQTLSHTGQVGVGPISIGPGTWNSDKRTKLANDLKRFVNVDQVLDTESSFLASSGDPLILDAWSKCIAAEGGLSMTLTSSSSNSATVQIQWTPYRTAPSFDPKVKQFAVSPNNSKIIAGQEYTKRGAQLGIRLPRIIQIERKSTATELSVVLDTEAGGARAYLPADLPAPEAVAHPCMDYLKDGTNSNFAACNSKTDDGYYWRVLTPRLSPYYEQGVSPGAAASEPPCNAAAAARGDKAVTARYPPAHASFLIVENNYAGAGKQHADSFTCNPQGQAKDMNGKLMPGDLRVICGIFQTQCSKQ